MDKEILERAKRILERISRDAPARDVRTPPIETTAEPATAVEQFKNEPQEPGSLYEVQSAAPAPGPLPDVEEGGELPEAEVVPEPQPRRCKLDRILDRVDAPRNMKPAELDCWDNEDERGRRLGKWGWMVW